MEDEKNDYGPVRGGFSVMGTLRKNYIERMIDDVNGMKVLVLDKETTGIVSSCISQSEILQKEVYFVELLGKRLGTERQEGEEDAPVSHLNAVCYLRPTEENKELLIHHLRNPKYNELHIYFSNILPSDFLGDLAEADEFECIRQVHEYFGDYFPINDDFFSLNISNPYLVYGKDPCTAEVVKRDCQGIISALLASKKRPIVRYQLSSKACSRIARVVQNEINNNSALFTFRQTEVEPVLLILDRQDDPVTPLLSQWTYQAMVHELLGIENCRVSLKGVPGVRKDLQEIVLNSRDDEFYNNAKFLNFGDLGVQVKRLVNEYQKKTKSNKNISSIADMQKFVEEYPEFLRQSGHVSKHVAVMSELSRQVGVRDLMEVSATEQNLACQEDHSGALREIYALLENPKVTNDDRLRLVMLYALRYRDRNTEIIEFKNILRDKFGVDHRKVFAIDRLLSWSRTDGLFSDKGIFNKGLKQIQGMVKGIENIYTQHTPRLLTTIDQLLKGRLKTTDYPIIDGRPSKVAPRIIFVYIVGGTTYEEATCISNLNAKNPHTRIILGGPTVLNSKSFITGVMEMGDIGINITHH